MLASVCRRFTLLVILQLHSVLCSAGFNGTLTRYLTLILPADCRLRPSICTVHFNLINRHQCQSTTSSCRINPRGMGQCNFVVNLRSCKEEAEPHALRQYVLWQFFVRTEHWRLYAVRNDTSAWLTIYYLLKSDSFTNTQHKLSDKWSIT